MTPFPTPYELVVSVAVAAFTRDAHGDRALTLGDLGAYARGLLDLELGGRIPCALLELR